eukprot:TRINITY_DN12418_c0_g1_i1.p2 TRINITY_DN12418_c0_g1~~TRINITY_DN12418_c0_g1_i1.p2  ORF type:complete len:404 (+),score=81.00 TRINITY_DN12418_c0_g1_i1:105-1316(+)
MDPKETDYLLIEPVRSTNADETPISRSAPQAITKPTLKSRPSGVRFSPDVAMESPLSRSSIPAPPSPVPRVFVESTAGLSASQPAKGRPVSLRARTFSQVKPLNVMGNHERIKRVGMKHYYLNDFYYTVVHIPWFVLFPIIVGAFLVIALVLSGLFYTDIGSLVPPSGTYTTFADVLFLSLSLLTAQGMAGYSTVQDNYGIKVVVTLCSLLSVIASAMVTGIIFARFSKPVARISFSKKMVVTNFQGMPVLMLRAVNLRKNFCLKAKCYISVSLYEITAEGTRMRRFHDLKLLRDVQAVFALQWTIMHVIDDKSPLAGETARSLKAKGAEFHVVLSGTDTSLVDKVHAFTSFNAEDLMYQTKFVDMFMNMGREEVTLDYRKLSDVEPDDSVDSISNVLDADDA